MERLSGTSSRELVRARELVDNCINKEERRRDVAISLNGKHVSHVIFKSGSPCEHWRDS